MTLRIPPPAPRIFTGTPKRDLLEGTDGADSLFGLAGNDILRSGAGNDLLDGGAGNDAMAGGAGNDVYVVDSLADKLTEKFDEGIDLVQTGLAVFRLPANFENLTFSLGGAHRGTGNALANVLTGNTGVDILSGRGGDDTLFGLGGADILYGGNGNDRLDGGAGADLFWGGAGDDTFIVDNPGDRIMEARREGSDTVEASISFALPNNVENLLLTGMKALNGTGNKLDNVLTGNSARNALSGGARNDTLEGLGGADRLTGGSGADHFVFNSDATGAAFDTIADFSHAEGDRIVFDRGVFDGLDGIRALGNATFLAADGAREAVTDAQRVIYDTASGALYYDADGAGGDAAAKLAVLVGSPVLAVADFLLIG